MQQLVPLPIKNIKPIGISFAQGEQQQVNDVIGNIKKCMYSFLKGRRHKQIMGLKNVKSSHQGHCISRIHLFFVFSTQLKHFLKKSMLYLKGLFTTDIYAPIIEQSQLACLTKSWRLKCKYSPSAFSSLLMQLPPQIGVRILQRPLLSIEASRANILFCFSNLHSSKI